ncbi:Cell division protein DivIC (FtsB), stabilizes FtsL against RasP cleavage [hydrothermal vent metagenome]|uniref:Cell division protein DivIC (FtsB), stabilizes FtsL against RasP cleavage n=1 Tax=hydrothermal vent metagenome TaxID=652676 RepID=A0A3B1B7N3_9ZZZZ
MKTIIAALIVLFVLLQFKLWLGEGGMKDVWALDKDIAAQTDKNVRLKERNQTLSAEVDDLKQGLEAIEERARYDLGMIREGETFFQVVD